MDHYHEVLIVRLVIFIKKTYQFINVVNGVSRWHKNANMGLFDHDGTMLTRVATISNASPSLWV